MNHSNISKYSKEEREHYSYECAKEMKEIGIKASEYAAEHNLNPSCLRAWMYRRNLLPLNKGEKSPTFVKIEPEPFILSIDYYGSRINVTENNLVPVLRAIREAI